MKMQILGCPVHRYRNKEGQRCASVNLDRNVDLIYSPHSLARDGDWILSIWHRLPSGRLINATDCLSRRMLSFKLESIPEENS